MMIDDKISPEIARSFPNVWKFIQSVKPRARRFLIHDDVATEIGLLLRDYPEVFMNNIQFAIPPYETCYIEMNSSKYFDALGSKLYGTVETRDTRVGYLIHNNKVAVFAKSESPDLKISQKIGFTPSLWTIDGSGLHFGFYECPIPNQHRKLTVALGETYNRTIENLNPELVYEIDRRIHLFVDRSCDFRDFRRTIPTFVGEMRNLFSLLLWINQTSIVDLQAVPASRKLVRGRPTVYMAHHVVKLKKGITRKRMMAIFRERANPRRHEVRGHFRHFDLKQGCTHQWSVLTDEEGHWHCTSCGGRRTWVNEHLRGDAGLGFVTKEYKS